MLSYIYINFYYFAVLPIKANIIVKIVIVFQSIITIHRHGLSIVI
jgi:hypothetical protein